jgi:peptide/nickel transport system permease protein
LATEAALPTASRPSRWRIALRHKGVIAGTVVLALVVAMALLAPWLDTVDPAELDPSVRNAKPGQVLEVLRDDGETGERVARFGTDHLGRDVWSRVVYGARVSLVVGLTVALLSVSIGLAIGLAAGWWRRLDGPVMRVMDGLMAIPGILLAIALVGIWGGGLVTVILAIVVPDVPRVVRLVRSVVLSVREEPYVEAAVTVGTAPLKLLWRHVLPNTVSPLIVQGTFVCASAMLAEAALSSRSTCWATGCATPSIRRWRSGADDTRSLLAAAPGREWDFGRSHKGRPGRRRAALCCQCDNWAWISVRSKIGGRGARCQASMSRSRAANTGGRSANPGVRSHSRNRWRLCSGSRASSYAVRECSSAWLQTNCMSPRSNAISTHNRGSAASRSMASRASICSGVSGGTPSNRCAVST